MNKNNTISDLPSIASRLLELRKHFDKTQKDMAAWAGITQLAWFNYESGKSLPNGKVLALLCTYGVNINWILTGIGDMLYDEKLISQNQSQSTEKLTHAIEQVEAWLDNHGKVIPSQKKAELLTHIYTDSMETGDDITQEKVNRLLKLVAG